MISTKVGRSPTNNDDVQGRSQGGGGATGASAPPFKKNKNPSSFVE